jgi:hypothetical protein
MHSCITGPNASNFLKTGLSRKTSGQQGPPIFNPAKFFLLSAEGKGLHEQAFHCWQPQREHSPGDCSHSCGHIIMHIHQFETLIASSCAWVLHVATFSTVCDGMQFHNYWREVCIHATLDHHRCINSSFIIESLGSLSRGLACIINTQVLRGQLNVFHFKISTT